MVPVIAACSYCARAGRERAQIRGMRRRRFDMAVGLGKLKLSQGECKWVMTVDANDTQLKLIVGTLNNMGKIMGCLTLGIILSVVSAIAQESGTATINGTVTDPSGALIAGAK